MTEYAARSLVVLSIAMCVLGCAPASTLASAERDVDPFERAGPYEVLVQRRALCCDSRGNAFDVIRPSALAPGVSAPLVTWGNGTIATPKKYDFFLRHLASWGYVVVATRDESTGSGQTMPDAVGKAQESHPLGVAVDFTRIAAAGHSQGAAGALHAAMASDSIRTVIAIDLPGQQFCRNDDCEDIPTGLRDGTSAFFMSGADDGLSPPEQGQGGPPPWPRRAAPWWAPGTTTSRDSPVVRSSRSAASGASTRTWAMPSPGSPGD